MAVKYKFVERAKPAAKGTKSDIYLQAPVTVFTETIEPDSFLNKLHEQSHMTKADIVRCLYSLQKLLMDELKNGNSVKTGIVGTFSPLVKKSKRPLTKGAMEIGISYRPDPEMKKELRIADIKKVRK
jgi:nucleoid DNA-binding protein